jgi:hypothetical protein
MLTPTFSQLKRFYRDMEIPMADDNDTNENVDTAASETALVPKKKRATRRPRAAAEAAPSAASVKSPKVPRKKRGENVEATPAVVEAAAAPNGVVKGARKARAAAQVEPSVNVSVIANDEMADLLQLEKENKTLRKALAEKLRAENADLRKRLGHT